MAKKPMTADQMGRKGGSRKVPKGLATMDPEEARRIRSEGGKARWKGHTKTKKAPK